MYLALIVLPLLGSIASGFFGRKIGVSGSHLITSSSIIITTLLSIIIFFEVGLNNISVSLQLFRWIDSESLNVLWSFHFDSLTVSMLIPVLIVSSLVHIYSIGYMSHDPHNQRFFSYLSLFTFMMIILVTANNFLLMFVGWEGVGVCSYLLVSFWYTRVAANQSSISAFLTNRVGDCFLTIGIFAILWSFGNVEYSTVFSLSPFISENVITLVGICLLIGAMAKSSQVGLHVWLPMAMEGPTPVSALIHAATMVTAGVYLLMRTSPVIEYSSTVLIICLWLGAITTVFSSLIGLFQQDIKKVIAYSTMSQLGMMVIAIGLSSYNIALFHLINHAFYKGLLFLGAGAVIHAVSDNQDFRKYGGLKHFLPLTYSVMLIASLSLVAFPYMTGFYSKDFILESAYGQFYFSSTVVYFIATIGAMFTTLYSVKVLYLTFLTNPNGPLINYKQAHEGDIYMVIPLIILAFFSVFFGYITKDLFIGLGSDFFSDNSLFIHPSHEIMLDTEFAVPYIFKLLPLFFTSILIVTSLLLSEFLPKLLLHFKFSRSGYNLFSFFSQRFLIELFYNKYITNIVLKLGGQTTKVLDKGSIEYIWHYGLEKGLLNLSRNLSSLDTGVITSYALYILIGLIFYILIPYILLSDNNLFLLIIFALLSINEVRSSIKNKSTTVGDYLQLHLSSSLSYCLYICLSAKDIFFYKEVFGACCFGLSLVLPLAPLLGDVAPVAADIVPAAKDIILPAADIRDIIVYSMVEDAPNPSNAPVALREIYTELNRLLPQLSTFITQFHNFVNDTGINVVMNSEGSLGIDVLNSLSDATAQNYANRVNVFDSLIHDRAHVIQELINRARDLEVQARQADNSYVSQLTQFTTRLSQLLRSYGHMTP
jgi:NADH-ubiquinone oxidoreductase chain 5